MRGKGGGEGGGEGAANSLLQILCETQISESSTWMN